MIMRSCLVHNHDFQLLGKNLYVANRRLDPIQEQHVYQLMGIYKTTREIRQHVEVLYKRRLTSDDVRSIKKRLSRADGRSEARRVSDLLKGQGNVEIKIEENVVRFVFFVPKCMSEDILKNSEVILVDATHQLNYGGYVLWHAY